MKKVLYAIYYFSSFILLFLACLFFFIKEWVYVNFGKIPISQIVFLLINPMEGSNTDIIYEFIYACVVPSLLIVSVVFLLLIVISILARTKQKNNFIYTINRIFKCGILIVSAVFILFSYCIVAEEMGINEYLQSLNTDTVMFDEFYVDPSTVNFTFPQKKRNLIYIFLESMETSYYSHKEGGTQDVNLIPELYQLAQENLTFNKENSVGFNVGRGATLTIGAMVGHTSGLPLKVSMDTNSYGVDSEYLPGATTLGDILEEAGYNQMLMIGSNATFGGRRSYFTQHGNYEIFDLFTARNRNLIPNNYYVWWGYEDYRLFDYAKEELLSLSNKESPFNFTMLTVDTHFPDGYLCPYCRNNHDNQYANVMSCSSKQVYDFIRWIQKQDFYENTTIIIAGDHCSMDNQFFLDLDEKYQRKCYYTIINSAIEYDGNGKEISTFDLFPTTLASMGIVFDSDRLGIGTNAFSDVPPIVELLGVDEMNRQIDMNSKYYNEFILKGTDKKENK